MKVTHENRKKPRARADIDMRFEMAGKEGFARIRDISASGVRCVMDHALPLMTQVGLVIVLPGPAGRREIVCRGAVVRSGPVSAKAADGPAGKGAAVPGKVAAAYETAIFFTQMRDADRVEVEEFVSSARPSA